MDEYDELTEDFAAEDWQRMYEEVFAAARYQVQQIDGLRAQLAAAHAENERLRADLVEQDRLMRIIEKNNGRIFAECQRLRAALASVNPLPCSVSTLTCKGLTDRQADTAGTEGVSDGNA